MSKCNAKWWPHWVDSCWLRGEELILGFFGLFQTLGNFRGFFWRTSRDSPIRDMSSRLQILFEDFSIFLRLRQRFRLKKSLKKSQKVSQLSKVCESLANSAKKSSKVPQSLIMSKKSQKSVVHRLDSCEFNEKPHQKNIQTLKISICLSALQFAANHWKVVQGQCVVHPPVNTRKKYVAKIPNLHRPDKHNNEKKSSLFADD